MKKIGLTVLGKRIAPVFDVSKTLLILKIDNKNIIYRKIVTLDAYDINSKFNTIKTFGIEILICGAISKHFMYKAEEYGINLISFICGNIDDVINSFISKKQLDLDFSMPGCRLNKDRNKYRF